MYKWLVIARNEYRLRTSGFRKFRPIFPILIIVLLGVYVFYFAPAFFNTFSDEFMTYFLTQAALTSIQILLLTIFLFFMVLPITYTLQQPQIEQYEILLSAPLSPKDLLLGKFFGDMPFYSIGVVLVAGSFTAILSSIGLDAIQIAISIVIFILIFFSAYWIGTVVAAILRTKLGKTARGRDLGKALALMIALPLVALIYALMSGAFIETAWDPNANEWTKFLFSIIPSSWGADLIISFASHPGDNLIIWKNTLLKLSALVLFFLGVIWLGGRVANRAYSLEPTSFSGEIAKPEGLFYKTVKISVGGGAFSVLLASIFKDFGRRLENISKIIYFIGLLFLISIFFVTSDEAELGPIDAIIMPAFILPIFVVFIIGEVTVRGKENLFIYRKAPRGEGSLIRARLLQGWILMIPISVCVIFFSLLRVPNISLSLIFAYVVILTMIIAAFVTFALGLFLLFPVFSEKPAELVGNMMFVSFVAIVTFIFSIIIFGETLGLISALILSWIFGLSMLMLGKRKLVNLE